MVSGNDIFNGIDWKAGPTVNGSRAGEDRAVNTGCPVAGRSPIPHPPSPIPGCYFR